MYDGGNKNLKRGKIKLFVAGLAISAVCILAPHSTEAAVPKAQMDGVMGQSIEDETVYDDTDMLDYPMLGSPIALFSSPTTKAVSTSRYRTKTKTARFRQPESDTTQRTRTANSNGKKAQPSAFTDCGKSKSSQSTQFL